MRILLGLCAWAIASFAIELFAGNVALGPELYRGTQESLDVWRALTKPDAPLPRVLVSGSGLRFLFNPDTNTPQPDIVYSAPVRIPRHLHGVYRVGSTVLRRERDARSAFSSRWKEAVVIGGQQWHELSQEFLERLAPPQRFEGVYYQAFLADGVVYRNADGVAKHAPFGQQPPEVVIQNRFSIEETLELSGEYLGQRLRDRFPGRSHFVLMANNPRSFTSPVLLDTERKRCVWIIPAALQDASENSPALALTWEAFRALLPESHGLALIKNPLSSAFRLADLSIVTVRRWLPLRLPQIRRSPAPLTGAPPMNAELWDSWLDEYTGTRRIAGQMDLLLDGEQFFTRLDEAFRGATNRIDVQMFIFDRDDVGVAIADQLRDRARALPVRVLHDRLGTISGGLSPPATPLPEGFVSPPSMSAYLKQNSKIKVRATLNPWLTHNHSKVIMVDGHQAWLGGMNFGREYRYEWHDAMVELTGPVVTNLQRDFGRAWAHAGPLGDLAYLSKLLTTSSDAPPLPAPGAAGVRLLPTRTAWKPFAAAVYGALRRSQNHVFVQNPYLFDKRTIIELAAARERGVDVRVILPRVNDFKPGERASLVVANYLLASGVRVYFYPGMTHTKAILADGWACVGSANLNHLSMRVNHEQSVATTDPRFVEQLRTRLFEADFARSLELRSPANVDWVDLMTNLLLEGP